MANGNVPHIIQVGGVNIAVELRDVYENIGEYVGVKKNTDGSIVPADGSTVKQLIDGGKAATIMVRVQPSNQSPRYRRITCSIDKVSTALPNLSGKALGTSGPTILAAHLPGHRRFR